jgi:hypothetical protein
MNDCCHCQGKGYHTNQREEGVPGTTSWRYTATCKCGASILKYIKGIVGVDLKHVTIITQDGKEIARKEHHLV